MAMQPRSIAIILLGVLALPACKKKDGSAAGSGSGGSGSATPAVGSGSGSATPPPAPAGAGTPFEATFEGKPYKFTHARIEGGAGIDYLWLSTAEIKCGEEGLGDITTLNIGVGKGPGGKHFAPGPIAASVGLTNHNIEFALTDLYGVLTLDNTEWKAGNKVKGTLKITDVGKDKKEYTGTGSFEASVCDVAEGDAARYAATPETADAGFVSGTLGGAKWTAKSAIAKMQHDADKNIDELTSLEFSDGDITCDNWTSSGGHIRFSVNGLDGTNSRNVFLGTPQMASAASWSEKDGKQHFMNGSSWVKFDALELKKGSTAKGSLYSESDAAGAKEHPDGAGKMSGTFTATVCD